MIMNRCHRVLQVLLFSLMGVPSSAGPPFLTDDPQPVDLGHVELYVFSLGQHSPGSSSGFAPAVEFNYGILPDTQFHIILPYAYNRSRDVPAQGGLGDTEIGIKYRFIHETDSLPQVGFFPFVEIPTGSLDQGLGSGHTRVYLPIWLQKSWGPWTTYGGYGWWRNPGDGNRDWSYAGWLLQRDFGEKLTLGLEAFHTTAMMIGAQASTGFNAGGQVNLSEKHHLLFSLGRNVSGDRQSVFYVGYQLTTGTFGNLGDWFRQSRARS
jgi:hypothetical protein